MRNKIKEKISIENSYISKDSWLFCRGNIEKQFYDKLKDENRDPVLQYIYDRLFTDEKYIRLKSKWEEKEFIEAMNLVILADYDFCNHVIEIEKIIENNKQIEELYQNSDKGALDIQKLNYLLLEILYPNEITMHLSKSEVLIDFLLNRTFLFISLAIILNMYAFLYKMLNQTFLDHNIWDSYTIQAIAWMKGKIFLDQDYNWLELALYKSKIFVSFPPVPSIVMLMLIPLFGNNTPNSFITTLFAVGSFITIYLLCRKRNISDFGAAFWAFFLAFGSNLIETSVKGGVWYQAQSLSFLLTCLSIYFILSKKRLHQYLSLVFLALAVGCRPLQLIYAPVYAYFLYVNLREEGYNLIKILTCLVKFSIPAALIGISYGLYNFARFGNPTEFGHRYLPEYASLNNTVFSLQYISQNIGNIFRLPEIKENFKIEFQRFNGFAFYIANPFYISFIFRFFQRIVRSCSRKSKLKLDWVDLLIPLCIFAHVIATLSHNTLGGWQFGLRYFIDMLPMAFLYILLKNPKIYILEYILAIFAVVLNIYGTLWVFLEWK